MSSYYDSKRNMTFRKENPEEFARKDIWKP